MIWLIVSIAIALSFDLMNGFHNASNTIATVVSTRALSPARAVFLGAVLNFTAIFIFPLWVADTIYEIIAIDPKDANYLTVVSSGLLGAIVWDGITWWFGIPTSSSHSLIGGLSGAGIAYAGTGILRWESLTQIVVFMFLAPLMGFILGFFLIIALCWIYRKNELAEVFRRFRHWQLFSAGLYALGHGAVNGQKTMGVIMALLLAGGAISYDTPLSLFNPTTGWVILISQLGLTVGTAFGGWRIVRTMGTKITKLRPIGGFCAETAGACTLFSAIYFGIPVSTTHTITSAIIGTSTAINRAARTNWVTASKIVWAWIFTLPAAALLGALFLSTAMVAFQI